MFSSRKTSVGSGNLPGGETGKVDMEVQTDGRAPFIQISTPTEKLADILLTSGMVTVMVIPPPDSVKVLLLPPTTLDKVMSKYCPTVNPFTGVSPFSASYTSALSPLPTLSEESWKQPLV